MEMLTRYRLSTEQGIRPAGLDDPFHCASVRIEAEALLDLDSDLMDGNC
jgi:hypothetical protein